MHPLKQLLMGVLGLILHYMSQRVKIYATLTNFIILGCIYASTFTMNLKLEDKNNEFYKEEEIIDTTNQVSRYSSFLEYWPQKAIDSMDYIVNRDQ